MTDERVEREPVRKTASSEGYLLSILEAVHRLHASVDEDGLLSAASAAFAALLSSAPSAVRIAHEGGVLRRLASDALGEPVAALMERATQQGLVVIDHQTPGGVAFPIRSSDRTVGAVYVAHPDANLTRNAAFEVVKLVAAHIGLASINLQHRCAAAYAQSALDHVPAVMALRDAKLEFERRLLLLRLDEVRGNVAAAARSLDMDRGQLARLMKKHSLERTAFRQAKGDGP